MSIFDKLFKKKADEKAVIKFWKEFESRAELYANILADGDEDSEDYLWMKGLVGNALKMCCLVRTCGYDFGFDTSRDPVRLVFHHMNDDYLKQVGELLAKHYPSSLANTIGFAVAE